MRKIIFRSLAAAGCAAFLISGCASGPSADTQSSANTATEATLDESRADDQTKPAAPESDGTVTVGEGPEVQYSSSQTAPSLSQVLLYGTVKRDGDNRFLMSNESPQSPQQDVVITASPENTRILDAVNGFPVDPDDIKDGDFIYAYVGPAMTMSLPPMTNAAVIICNIPADFKVPEYVTIQSAEIGADNASAVIIADGNNTYKVNEDSVLLPYLTRNIVTVQDLEKGRTCLIWTTQESPDQVNKLVLFPEDTASGPDQENELQPI